MAPPSNGSAVRQAGFKGKEEIYKEKRRKKIYLIYTYLFEIITSQL
jgi:hypothetical protein